MFEILFLLRPLTKHFLFLDTTCIITLEKCDRDCLSVMNFFKTMLPDCNVSYLLLGIQNQALKIFYSRLTERKKNECGDQPPVCTVVVRSSNTTLHGAMVKAFDTN